MEEPSSTFGDVLHQLQTLHDKELALLRTQNAVLRDESVGLRGENSKLQQEIERLRGREEAMSDDAGGRDVHVPVMAPDVPEAPTPRGLPPQRTLVTMRSMTSSRLMDEASGSSGLRHWAAWIVSKRRFDLVIGLVITANAVTIGVEADHRANGVDVPMPVWVLEYSFIAVYTLELLLRFCAAGTCKALESNWVKLDLVLVLCAYASEFTELFEGTVTLAPWLDATLDKVLLARILRLARLVRVLRVVIQFRTLYILVSGLMNSLLTLLWTGTVIFVLIYCFAILGLELVVEDDAAGEAYNATVKYYFDGLFETMLTLLQGVTLDSLGGVYRPLIIAKPYLVIYFVAFILLASIALVNLVTAIMVEGALNQASNDKETQSIWLAEQKSIHIKELHKMFVDMDTDGSGKLNMRELEEAGEDVKARIMDLGDANTLKEVFQILDYDNNNEVNIDEFCEGMLKIENGTKMEIFAIQKMCQSIYKDGKEIKSMLAAQRNACAGAQEMEM